MFKNVKREYLILLIIIIVLSTYLLRKDSNKVEFDIPELSSIDKNTIKKIVIENSKGSFSLKIDKKIWSLEPESFPVLDDKVSKMLTLLSKTDISDLISRAGQYSKFGLGENNRTIIRAIGDSVDLRKLTIGNNAESGNRTFIKLEGDPIVYQARGNYKDSFDIKKEDIINKKIFSFNPSDINEIIIEKMGIVVNFIKIDESELIKKEVKTEKNETQKAEVKMIWINKSDKKKVNDKEIDSFISKNSNISCESYIIKKKIEDQKGSLSITFIDKTKKSYTLNLNRSAVSEKEKSYTVSSNSSQFLFLLSKENIESIDIDPENLKNLEVKKN